MGVAIQGLRVRLPLRRTLPPPLPWALTTVRGLIRVVPTIVLCVTLPPEGDALVILAHKLEGR